MVRPRVRVHPGVAAAAVQGLQLLQLQIQGPIILVLSVSYYLDMEQNDVTVTLCIIRRLSALLLMHTAITAAEHTSDQEHEPCSWAVSTRPVNPDSVYRPSVSIALLVG